MRLARRATLLVAFYLLTSAETAHAECAWVLWAYGLTEGMGSSYEVELARATRQECLTEVRGMGRRMKAHGYTVTGGETDSSEVVGSKSGTSFKYFCLPDTVDPRGPKGK